MMLYRMGEVMGWTHEEMMNMDYRVFNRYYGYWLAERLEEEEQRRIEEAKNKNK